MMGPGDPVPLVVRAQTGSGLIGDGTSDPLPVIGTTFTYDNGVQVDVALPLDAAPDVIGAMLCSLGVARGEAVRPGDREQLALVLSRLTVADLIRRLG